MSAQIIGLQDWLATPLGRYLLAWEQAQCDEAVANIFGYHALQLGLPDLQGLRANRIAHRWLATELAERRPAAAAIPGTSVVGASLLTDFSALPFPAASLDLLLLPHTLDTHADPHATLREVARVLVPEGRVVICGFNPHSLWGLRRSRERLFERLGWAQPTWPQTRQHLAYRRVRDWLHLLDFEVEVGHFGAYRLAVDSDKWLQRLDWMDSAGARWWPIFGAAYFLVAVKRVHGVRLLEVPRRQAVAGARMPMPVAHRSGDN